MAESNIVVHRMGEVEVIEFIDRSILEQRNINKVEAELIALAERSGWPRFVISFAGVKSISSSVLGMLMSVNKKVRSLKGEIRLSNIHPQIAEVFKLTKLDTVLKVFDSTDKALEKFGN